MHCRGRSRLEHQLHRPSQVRPFSRSRDHPQLMVVEVDPETLFVVEGISEGVLEEQRAVNTAPNTQGQ